MKYAMLINLGPRARDWRNLTEQEQKEIAAGYQEVNQTPGVTPNELRLQGPETATTVRVEDGQTLTTDGPFVEIKEALDGWLIYEAADLDAAIELAAKIPAATMGGKVEIRPIAG
ncbi:MAG TPA: YciI family protein [Solirubrobacteraceae bacterium]|nr:YciI family protein [Solirubrobacteraceae bacterium]HUB72743.1 YciI family protein [Solirubrobacteraceae bacterium]